MPAISKADRQRFWASVQRNGPDECWPFLKQDGTPCTRYGQFSLNGRLYRATHVALMLTSRPRGNGNRFALHSCDNPRCVNPAHLRWGTAAENAADRSERQRAGRRVPRRILTAEEIIEITSKPMDVEKLRAMGLWRWQIMELAALQMDVAAAKLAAP